MAWNHRIMAHEHKGDVYFQIHEVYYDENNTPNSYTKDAISIGGDDLKTITWTLNKMLECRKKPILWAGEKFPNECKMKYKCVLCGRDNFDRPSPHNCSGGYRKRALQWTIIYK